MFWESTTFLNVEYLDFRLKFLRRSPTQKVRFQRIIGNIRCLQIGGRRKYPLIWGWKSTYRVCRTQAVTFPKHPKVPEGTNCNSLTKLTAEKLEQIPAKGWFGERIQTHCQDRVFQHNQCEILRLEYFGGVSFDGAVAKELSEELGVGDPQLGVTRVFNHLYSPDVHSSLFAILSFSCILISEEDAKSSLMCDQHCRCALITDCHISV